MAVTMIEHKVGNGKPYRVPKLHKVVWSIKDPRRLMQPTWANPKFRELDDWLKENCQHPYYHGPAWEQTSFIEFECDEDAVMFSLRWV